MRQRFFDSSLKRTRWFAAAATAWLALATPLWAASSIFMSGTGYLATDQLSSLGPSGYDISGNLVAVYADQHLELYDRTTWAPIADLGNAGYATTTFNSFVRFDPSGDALWVGYTTIGNANDRIYKVSNLSTTPTWDCVATVGGNFDLAFSGTTPYVSGLNSTSWDDPNAIWRLDPVVGTNKYSLTEIAEIGGSSAGLAFDTAGNLYCATNFGANDELVRFSTSQVSGGGLSLIEGDVLTKLPCAGNSVSVDAAGHVLFSCNSATFVEGTYYQLASTLGMWNGTVSDANNYSVVGSAGANHWYMAVRADGDVTATGKAYLNDGGAWGYPVTGLAEITHLMTGDANGDNSVDFTDLTTLLSMYNQTVSDNGWAAGDFNGDGYIDFTDLTSLLANYNQSSGGGAVTAVPEPSTLTLLALFASAVGGFGLCRGRWNAVGTWQPRRGR